MGLVETAMSWNSCWQLHGNLKAIKSWQETWESSSGGLGALRAMFELVTEDESSSPHREGEVCYAVEDQA